MYIADQLAEFGSARAASSRTRSASGRSGDSRHAPAEKLARFVVLPAVAGGGRDRRFLHVPHDAPGSSASGGNPCSRPGAAARTTKRPGSPSGAASQTKSSSPSPIPCEQPSFRPGGCPRLSARHRRCEPSSCSTRRIPCSRSHREQEARSPKRRHFRRLLVQRMCADMDLGRLPPGRAPAPASRVPGGQSYLVSYWQRVVLSPANDDDPGDPVPRRYLVVAWHDIGRIVKDHIAHALLRGADPEPRERRRRGRADHLRAALAQRRVHRGGPLSDDSLRLAGAGLARRERRV